MKKNIKELMCAEVENVSGGGIGYKCVCNNDITTAFIAASINQCAETCCVSPHNNYIYGLYSYTCACMGSGIFLGSQIKFPPLAINGRIIIS